jgi:hypothetical protein
MTPVGLTAHGASRMQQRGLPPLILDWLHRFGHEHYDGRGGVVLHFNKPARRRLEHELGRMPMRRMKEWLDVYAVVSTEDGRIITAGHRHRRLKNK